MLPYKKYIVIQYKDILEVVSEAVRLETTIPQSDKSMWETSLSL